MQDSNCFLLPAFFFTISQFFVLEIATDTKLAASYALSPISGSKENREYIYSNMITLRTRGILAEHI